MTEQDLTHGTADDPHTWTGAYALDALDDVDRRRAEQHLAGCEPCRREARALRVTAAALATTVARPPSPGTRAAVLDRIGRTPQEAPPTSPTSPREARNRPRRTSLLAVAAALVVAVGGSGLAGYGNARLGEARRIEAQAAALSAIVTDPQARRVTNPVTTGGTVTLFVEPDGRAALVANGTGALPQDRVYQVWRMTSTGAKSAGLGPSGTDGGRSWAAVLDGLLPGEKVAVTVEPGGGSEQPTTTPIAFCPVP